MTIRKPHALKLLANTARRDRVAPSTQGLPPITETPAPPSWLSLDAAAEFRRLAAILIANVMMTEGKIGMLAHACALHSRLVTAWTSGEMPSASLLSVHRRMLGDLGVTHVASPPAAGKPNIFLDNLKRR